MLIFCMHLPCSFAESPVVLAFAVAVSLNRAQVTVTVMGMGIGMGMVTGWYGCYCSLLRMQIAD